MPLWSAATIVADIGQRFGNVENNDDEFTRDAIPVNQKPKCQYDPQKLNSRKHRTVVTNEPNRNGDDRDQRDRGYAKGKRP